MRRHRRSPREVFLQTKSLGHDLPGDVHAHIADVPRLILVAGDVLLAVGEADDEAVVCAVLCQPLGFLGLSERIVNGVAVNGQTGLVL